MEKFKTSTKLEIRAHDEDVRKYLESCISKSESICLKEIREEIQTVVPKAVNGMYVP